MKKLILLLIFIPYILHSQVNRYPIVDSLTIGNATDTTLFWNFKGSESGAFTFGLGSLSVNTGDTLIVNVGHCPDKALVSWFNNYPIYLDSATITDCYTSSINGTTQKNCSFIYQYFPDKWLAIRFQSDSTTGKIYFKYVR